MNLNVLKAKIQRNNLIKYAGKYFVDETSDIIKRMNREGKKALIGIYKNRGVYTIIGEKYLYYSTSSGKRGEIRIDDFTEALHENGCRIGSGYFKFKFMYRNIVLSNNDKVWLHNSNTMFSLWNTMLWIQEEIKKKDSLPTTK